MGKLKVQDLDNLISSHFDAFIQQRNAGNPPEIYPGGIEHPVGMERPKLLQDLLDRIKNRGEVRIPEYWRNSWEDRMDQLRRERPDLPVWNYMDQWKEKRPIGPAR